MRRASPLYSPLALAVVAAVVGCTPSQSTNRSAVDVRRPLCEHRPAGDDPLDARIRALVDERSADEVRHIALGHAWAAKARRTLDPGYLVQAEACASLVLDGAPSHSEARVLLGLARLDAHDFRAAREHAHVVLERQPAHPQALAILSDALLELGDMAGAEDAVQRMLDAKPGLPAYARGAHLRWLRGDSEGASALYARAIQIGMHSDDVETLAWVITEAATVFFAAGDVDGAAAGFALALSKRPAYPPALVGAARCHLAAGHAAKALPLLEQALAAMPLAETAWLLADAREALDDEGGTAEARTLVEKLGVHDRRTLARYLAERGEDPLRAVSLARAEHAERPGLYSQDALAWALFRAGEVDEARDVVEQMAGLGSADLEIVRHREAITSSL